MTILELLINCKNHNEYGCPKCFKYKGKLFKRYEINLKEHYYFYEDSLSNNFLTYINNQCELVEIIEPATEEPELIPLFDEDDFYSNHEICERMNMVIKELNELKKNL